MGARHLEPPQRERQGSEARDRSAFPTVRLAYWSGLDLFTRLAASSALTSAWSRPLRSCSRVQAQSMPDGEVSPP